MPPKRVAEDARLIACFQDHSKGLERLGWKHNDAQEFLDAQLGLLKSLVRVSLSLPKSRLKMLINGAKLSLESQEVVLLIEKIRGALSYAMERLRNAGSGKFLPASVLSLSKCWQNSMKALRESRKEKKTKKKGSQATETSQGASPKQKEKKNIRKLFGLSPKAKAIEVLSSSDSESQCHDLASSSRALPTQPSSSSSSKALTLPTQPSSSSSSKALVDEGSSGCIHAKHLHQNKLLTLHMLCCC